MATASSLANSWLLENPGDKVWRPKLFKSYPLLAMCSRMKNAFKGGQFGGRYNLYPTETGPGAAGSNQLAQAVTNARANQYGQANVYQVPPVDYWQYTSINTLTVAQARNSETSFVSMFEKNMKDLYHRALMDIAPQLYGLGYLSIGTIATISTTVVANDTVTLTLPDQLRNFYPQSTFCDFAANATSGNMRARASTTNTTGLQVNSVNAGKIVFAYGVTDSTHGSTGVSVGDTIFNATSDTTVNLGGIIGLEAICPAGGVTNPNDLFFNVNRFLAGERAYGTSYNGTNDGDVVEMINNARTHSKRVAEGEQDTFVCNPGTFTQLRKQLRTQNRYASSELITRPITGWSELPGEMDGFVRGIDIGGALVVEDANCPANRVWGFMEEDLEYADAEQGFGVPIDWDGQTLRCAYTTGVDGWEMAAVAIHNFFVRNPGNLLNIQCNPAAY